MGLEIFKLIKRSAIRGATSVVVAIFLNIVCGSLEAIPAYQVGRSNNSNDLVYACDVEGPKLEMYEDAKEISVKVHSKEDISVEGTEVSKQESIAVTTAPVIPYTEEEQRMMEYIIQQEVRGATLQHKRIIAWVIVNRVLSDKFAYAETISDVILAKGQFSSVNNYYNHTYEPDEDTKQAVREVLNGECEDLSNGALFFYAPRWASQKAASYFENSLTFLFELEGHRFFK